MRRAVLGLAAFVTVFGVVSVFVVWLVEHDVLSDALENAAQGHEYPVEVTLSAEEAFGSEWSGVAVVCPYETREAAEQKLGIERLDTPELGLDDSENAAIMLNERGGFETTTYQRARIDLCHRSTVASVRPVGHLTFRRPTPDSAWQLIGALP